MAGNGPSPFGSVPGFDEGGGTAAVAAAVPPPVIEQPITNPESLMEMGNRFLGQHKAEMAARTKEVDNVFSRQALNIENMSKMLDDTTASLKASKEGRSNLPLMALGAGMLGSPGDFGTQLGAGLKQMVPAIQKQRGDDEDTQFKLMQMQMRRTGIENAPLEQKLAYMRALQTGDEAGIRAVEAAMLKASGQTDKTGQKASELEEKANNHAFQRALDQMKALPADHFSTPAERDAALLSYYQGIARSLKVPEETIAKFVESNRTIFNTAPKGGFNVPGMNPANAEKEAEEAKKLGLGPRPLGSPYANLTNPADALKTFQVENAEFIKMTKDNSTDSQKNLDELRNIDRAEAILKKYPTITGKTGNIIPNAWQLPKAERDELDAIFKKNQVYGAPQGQGAISNFERELFEKAKPRMDNLLPANLNLIAVQKQILEDQIQKRKFMNAYFGHYKTIKGADDMWVEYARSKEGRAAFDNPETGMVEANPARISWQEWMRKQHGDPTQTHARGGQHKAGGAVHLGSEWD